MFRKRLNKLALFPRKENVMGWYKALQMSVCGTKTQAAGWTQQIRAAFVVGKGWLMFQVETQHASYLLLLLVYSYYIYWCIVKKNRAIQIVQREWKHCVDVVLQLAFWPRYLVFWEAYQREVEGFKIFVYVACRIAKDLRFSRPFHLLRLCYWKRAGNLIHFPALGSWPVGHSSSSAHTSAIYFLHFSFF